MEAAWGHIQDILRKSLNPGHFQVWIKPLEAEVKGRSLHLTAPNEFVAVWVRDKMLSTIGEAAAASLGYRPEVVVEVGRNGNNAGSGELPVAPRAASSSRLASGTGIQLGLPLTVGAGDRPKRQWRFSFDDFVVGPCNELAYAAAQGLCRDTLASDRIFLSSSSGLGKTHLLQALGCALSGMGNGRSARVEYLTGEEFATRMVIALKSKSIEQFKARFRDNVDVLLLEDVHFFQGKEKLQGELMATLNALQENGSKVVMTSSFLPRELKDVDSHLVSRFCSGFLAVIDRPDFEMRRRILHSKARVFQAALPDAVAEMMAERIKTDIRQLESCLRNLVLKARLLNRKITMDLACQVVGDCALEQPEMSLDRIVDFICNSFELNLRQLSSKSRRHQVVLARNTAFFLARKYTDLSLKDIGERFNRRHSTVIKGITNVERELRQETPLGRQLERTIGMLDKAPGETVDGNAVSREEVCGRC